MRPPSPGTQVGSGAEEVGDGWGHPAKDPRPARACAGDSLGETPFELESLAAAVRQAVERGERPDGGQVAVAAVGGQHSREVAIAQHVKWRDRRGLGEGPVEGLQKGHHFIARRNVLGGLGT